VIAEGHGAAMFLRAFVRAPKRFGAHHLLIMVSTAEVPARLKETLEGHGADLAHITCDGLAQDDGLNGAEKTKVFSKWAAKNRRSALLNWSKKV